MNTYTSPNDYAASTDAKRIQAAIDDAVAMGINKTVIPRMNAVSQTALWVIDETVLLPDDFALILDHCTLRLADGVYCNMFANRNCRTPLGGHPEGKQQHISITGIGHVVLDGGNYNGLSERNSGQDGRPTIDYNTMILFRNVSNFHISGIEIHRMRWWAMTFLFCTDGILQNIRFQADLSAMDADGNRLNRLPNEYEDIYIKNADGIDLRSGCARFLIENITGVTEDDSVALTVLSGKLESRLDVPAMSHDVHDVIIRNVQTDCFCCANVRLLNKDGNKLYNILVDGVQDASADQPYRAHSAVRIGDPRYTNVCETQSGDICNITVRNVTSRAKHGVHIDTVLTDSSIENVRMFDPFDNQLAVWQK